MKQRPLTLGVLVVLSIFSIAYIIGCGGGGGSSADRGTIPGLVSAEDSTIQSLNTTIQSSGVEWTAASTAVSQMSETDQKYLCGVIEEEPDTARVLGRSVAATATPIPSSLDWRSKDSKNWLSSVKEQGKCSSCVAFASTAVMESLAKITSNDETYTLDLAESDLFSCGGATCAQGWKLSEAATYIQNNGVADESCLPYSAADNVCDNRCTDHSTRTNTISNWYWVKGESADVIKQYLQNGPVMASMAVYKDLFYYKSGIYQHVWGDKIGYHGVAIVGYDDTNQYWIAKNSWGTNWGESGYFRIKYGDCEIDNYVFVFEMEGSNLSGYTGTELTVTATPTGTEGQYDVSCDTESDIASLEVRCNDSDSWETIAEGITKTCTYATDGNYMPSCRLNSTTTASTLVEMTYSGGVIPTSGGEMVSVGWDYSCTIYGAGTVQCWGNNNKGQIGNGTGGVPTSYNIPPSVATGITDAVSMDAGGDNTSGFTCAVLSSGSLMCWGDNSGGQLGDGTTTMRKAPVTVQGVYNVADVSAGENYLNPFICALIKDGTVKCWGKNNRGQLGNGEKTSKIYGPVTVTGLSGAVDIAVGHSHSCAVISSGAVKCWGRGIEGQLGNGGMLDSAVPVSVSGISDAVAISGGEHRMCVVMSTGGIKCWGKNEYGQFGDGTTNSSSVPVDTKNITDAIAVSTGRHLTCAVISSGGVKCWGRNNYGGLGYIGSDSTVPVDVPGISTAIGVSAGADHACVKRSDDSVKCWGRNNRGQVGPWIPAAYCGDGNLDTGETCDDGNAISGDGCSSSCIAEACGNGVVDSGEDCDDGNAVTESCTYGQTSCTVCDASCKSVAGSTSYCGNNSTDSGNGEQCDVGGNNGVSCNPPYGSSCSYCSSTCTTITTPGPNCGDGTTQTAEGEQCDDGAGNNVVCTAAYGSTCNYCDWKCADITVQGANCGDGTTDVGNGEQCDDGATNGIVCTAAYGSSCNYCAGSCNTATVQGPYCGDNTVDVTDGEACDDGNTTPGDGCDGSCQLEQVCGNGLLEGTEQCDDGNTVTEICTYGQTSCTVCNATCNNAAGATSYCGDSSLDVANSEVCDDGNTINCDGCSSICKPDSYSYSFPANKTFDSDTNGWNLHIEPGTIAGTAQWTSDYNGSAHIAISGAPSSAGLKFLLPQNLYAGDKITIRVYRASTFTNASGPHIRIRDNSNTLIENGSFPTNAIGWYTFTHTLTQDIPAGYQFIIGAVVWPGIKNWYFDWVALNDSCQQCGNGIIETGENCDDGPANGSVCTASPNSSCNYCDNACSTLTTVTGGNCGNGVVEGTEQCDDGNTVTEACVYSQTSCIVCAATCVNAAGATSYCGDSTVDAANGETCDDGNAVSGDGCSATCIIEGLVWITIPAGDFVIGCDSSETGCMSDAQPKHTVTLSAFQIMKYPVTNKQYSQCVASSACTAPLSSASYSRAFYYGNPTYDDYPVLYISWDTAVDFCQNIGATLPTEAQWEKAARGTGGQTYPWGGAAPSCTFANYYTGALCVGDTSEVGIYTAGASPYGILDMAGNALEWTNDWYDSSYYSTGPTIDPPGPASGAEKVLRGGSWHHNNFYLRSSFRTYQPPNSATNDITFRCVK